MYALGALAVVLAAVLWSADGFLRQELYSAPSMLVVALEHAFGTLLYAPFVARGWATVRSLRGRDWALLVGLCAVSGLLALFLYTKALSYVGYVPLSVVVLLQKTQPFFAVACAVVLLRERLTPRFVAAGLAAVAGGYLTTFGWNAPDWSADGSTIAAALMAVGAAACWGGATAFSKKLLDGRSPAVLTGLRLAVTAVMACALSAALGQAGAAAALTASQWISLVAIACTAGGVALGIYYWGLRRIPASHSTVYELAWPLSAMALDYGVNGVVLSPAQLAGGAVLLAAMFSLPRRQA